MDKGKLLTVLVFVNIIVALSVVAFLSYELYVVHGIQQAVLHQSTGGGSKAVSLPGTATAGSVNATITEPGTYDYSSVPIDPVRQSLYRPSCVVVIGSDSCPHTQAILQYLRHEGYRFLYYRVDEPAPGVGTATDFVPISATSTGYQLFGAVSGLAGLGDAIPMWIGIHDGHVSTVGVGFPEDPARFAGYFREGVVWGPQPHALVDSDARALKQVMEKLGVDIDSCSSGK